MTERIRRNERLTTEQASRLQAVREEFAARSPKSAPLESGDYAGSMNIKEHPRRCKGAGD